jgi:hypothetical protein
MCARILLMLRGKGDLPRNKRAARKLDPSVRRIETQ